MVSALVCIASWAWLIWLVFGRDEQQAASDREFWNDPDGVGEDGIRAGWYER